MGNLTVGHIEDAMRYLTDTDAWYLSEKPRQIIVPPNLAKIANEILSGEKEEEMKSSLDCIVDEQIARLRDER